MLIVLKYAFMYLFKYVKYLYFLAFSKLRILQDYVFELFLHHSLFYLCFVIDINL